VDHFASHAATTSHATARNDVAYRRIDSSTEPRFDATELMQCWHTVSEAEHELTALSRGQGQPDRIHLRFVVGPQPSSVGRPNNRRAGDRELQPARGFNRLALRRRRTGDRSPSSPPPAKAPPPGTPHRSARAEPQPCVSETPAPTYWGSASAKAGPFVAAHGRGLGSDASSTRSMGSSLSKHSLLREDSAPPRGRS
jgi:hypothetical protein